MMDLQSGLHGVVVVLALVVLGCAFLVVRKMKAERGLGPALVAFIVPPYAFVWGWRNADRTGLRAVMRLFVAAGVLLIAAPVVTYMLARGAASDEVAEGPTSGSPRLESPDGAARIRVEGAPGSQRLLLVRVSTGDVLLLQDIPGTTYSEVSISDDGGRVRYVAQRPGRDSARYEIPLLGGPERRVSDR